MRVAITTDGNSVYPHFGHCPLFTIVEIEDREVKNQETIENPGHSPGFLPRFLKEKGVSFIITGGMGQRAIRMFEEFGVDTLIGVTGSIQEVIYGLIEGTLEGGESLCTHDEHGDQRFHGTGCDHPGEHGCNP